MMYLLIVLVAVAVLYKHVHCALPKPAYHCDNENLEAKYFNESCTSDLECFGRMSMTCQNGFCRCAEDYVPETRFVGEDASQTVCVSAPYLFSKCTTVCKRPAVCKEHTSPDNKVEKVCQCVAPFVLKSGSCVMECPAEEVYDHNKYKCIPRCKANEMKINDTCFPIGKLTDKCESNLQCQPSFSECQNKVCSCNEGFVSENGLCVPEHVSCQHGEAAKVNNKYFQCKVIRRDVKKEDGHSVLTELADDCPPNHFCHMVGGVYRAENANGYCCPKGPARCPVGKPLESKKCGSYESGKSCPWESHYCHNTGNPGEELCCPKQCDASMMLVNGKCFASSRLDNACVINQQCTDYNSECIDGKCKCTAGAKESGAYYKYCTRECKEGEIMHDNKCFAPLELGESCKEEKWRCPMNSFCNKYNVCSCSCPKFTLSKNVCAPLPKCPAVRREMFLRSGAMGMVAEMDAKAYAPISSAKRSELLANITFCSVTNKQAPQGVEVVQQCPENQYCATYITGLGICCKKPEPKCPNGKVPSSVGKCTPGNPLTCGVNQYCFDSLYTADPDSPIGHLCCESRKEEENDDD